MLMIDGSFMGLGFRRFSEPCRGKRVMLPAISAAQLMDPLWRWLLGFGDKIKVLGSKALRDEFTRVVVTLGGYYSKYE